jgi:vitamin B12 transporter
MIRRAALFALVIAPAAAFAQARTIEVSDTARLEPVVITATRDSVKQSVPTASTTVITGEALRTQGIVTVQQALSLISSMTTVQAGSYGAATTLYTRGGQSNYTLLLVDGAPVNDPGGFLDLGNLTTDNVDRIEVVEGPSSVLYGSGAISGVIQIFTRRPGAISFANVSASGGTFGTRAYDLAFGTGKESVGISLDAARYRTNGILDFNNSASNDVYSGLLRFGHSGGAHLDFSGRQMKSDYHFPTDFTGAAVDSNQQTSGRLTVLAADGGFYMGKKVEFRVLGAATENKSTSQNIPDNAGDSTAFYYVDPSTLRQWSVDARFAFHLSGASAITAGALYADQQVKSSDSSWSNTFTDTSSFQHSRNNTAYYANATGDIGPKVSYNAGARITVSDQFGTFTSYRVAAGFALSPKTSFRGSVGSSFREPSFYEEYATGFATGNPDLKPETGTAWEIGVNQSFGKEGTSLSVTYFSQRFTNMIQYDPGVAPGDPNYYNIAAADASGVEANFHGVISKQWWLDAGYTWLSTKVVSSISSGDPTATLIPGEPLLRRPSNAGNIGINYQMVRKLSFGVQAQYVGSRQDIDYNLGSRVTLPSYALVNASILLSLKADTEGRFIAVTARGTNLFNTGYQQTVGFEAPGRALLVGIRLGVGY